MADDLAGRVPAVSVVVPVYNNAPFIAETMSSILAQTFTDFEVVVSDHGSTDGTWELLQAYGQDARVRLLRTSRKVGGAPENWTIATAAARGEYLKLVCGDDVLAPTCLEKQVAAMRAHPDVVMVAARRDVITATGSVVVRSWGLPRLAGRVPGREAVRRSVRAGTNIFGEPGCVLLRRQVLVDVGGWDATYPYIIDQYTYSKVLMQGDLHAIPESLASFRISNGQWSKSLASQQARQILDFHTALAESFPGVLGPGDLRVGAVRARALSFARRVTYAVLRRRMNAPECAADSPSPGMRTLPARGGSRE